MRLAYQFDYPDSKKMLTLYPEVYNIETDITKRKSWFVVTLINSNNTKNVKAVPF